MSRTLSTAEVDELRALTPGTANVIHLNHAGSSLPSEAVLETQLTHLRSEASIGGYEAGDQQAEADSAVYDSIATLINCAPHEIARVEHATSAWNSGFWSIPMEPGQRILTANAAYGANAIGFLRARERRGVNLEVIPDDEHGQVDVSALANALDSDVALVAITHVPTNGGLVNPAADIGALTRAAGVPFLLDACQSVGQRHLDVKAIGCDLLSATGRKYLRGPRGTGFLYASDRIIDRLLPDEPDHHGADWVAPFRYELKPGARRYERWEYNHAAWLGLGTAADEAIAIGIDRIEATVATQADKLRQRLTAAGFAVMDLGAHRCGIVTVACNGFQGATIKEALAAESINVSTSSPRSTLFDATARGLPDLLRLSVHYLTTDDEIATATEVLTELAVG